MDLIIDTGTWLKLEKLNKLNLFQSINLYRWAKIQITHEVEKELIYFNCISWIKKKTQILPIYDQEIYQEARDLDFDEADASILSFGKITNNSIIIISEDRPLIDYARLNDFKAIFLADLFQIFTGMGNLSKKELYNLIVNLYDLRNINLKKKKTILTWRDTFK
jgi:hypothetical protein